MSEPKATIGRLGHCARCVHYEVDVKMSAELSPDRRTHDGWCHFEPPKLVVIPQGTRLALKAMFPPMKANEWCGQFSVLPERAS